MLKNVLSWLLSFLVAASFAVFQRLTGPTYPIRGKVDISESSAVYRFPRSCTIGEPCVLKISFHGEMKAYVVYKRYKTNDAPANVEFTAKDAGYKAILPEQPPAGKIVYQVFVKTSSGDVGLTANPVVVRFKGAVPPFVLVSHVVFMFLFMIFSVKIFLSSIYGTVPAKRVVVFNYLFLLVGGFVFGSLTQRYAFGKYWTGFPFGWDLTDNKTLITLVFWTMALWAVLKEKNHKLWINIAFAVTILVYFVPHSLFGSELDYSSSLPEVR